MKHDNVACDTKIILSVIFMSHIEQQQIYSYYIYVEAMKVKHTTH
jgi:hypothetical protein